MAGNIGRVARRIWSCCPQSARNVVSDVCASSSSSTPFSAAAVARPSLRNPSASMQQPRLGARKQPVQYHTRLPGEIGAIASLMPRHNATATALLVSKVSGDLTLEIEGILAKYVSPI